MVDEATFEEDLTLFGALSNRLRYRLLQEMRHYQLVSHRKTAKKLGVSPQKAYDQLKLLGKKYQLVRLLDLGVIFSLRIEPLLTVTDLETQKKYTLDDLPEETAVKICDALSNKTRLKLYYTILDAHRRGITPSIDTLSSLESMVPSRIEKALKPLAQQEIIQIVEPYEDKHNLKSKRKYKIVKLKKIIQIKPKLAPLSEAFSILMRVAEKTPYETKKEKTKTKEETEKKKTLTSITLEVGGVNQYEGGTLKVPTQSIPHYKNITDCI